MKIYINSANESWVVDRFKEEWIDYNPEIVTNNLEEADLIWLIAPWTWKKVQKKYLKKLPVICTIHHIDIDKFVDNEKKNFYKREKYIDQYHSISDKTTEQLVNLTTKKITTIPFWINQNIFFEIKDNHYLKEKYNLSSKSFLIGSFQRDTEGKDMVSPKLSKGPDRLIEIYKYYSSIHKNIEIILTGKRRDYLIKKLNEVEIPYKYFEMTKYSDLNELYNCLDLYIVASRVEGGPQAIMECAITKTPIISTDVGIASSILENKAIFDMKTYSSSRPSNKIAFQNVQKYTIPSWFENYKSLFKSML